MRDVCRDSVLCYNFSHPSVTVPEDEIWQRDAAVREYPVPCSDGKTDIPVFSDSLHNTKLYSEFLHWMRTSIMYIFLDSDLICSGNSKEIHSPLQLSLSPFS